MKPGNILVCAVLAVTLVACTSSAERKREKANAKTAALSYTELGVEYLRKGDFQTSRTKLKKALELDPDLPQAHSTMALLYEEVGETKLAEKHYKKALRLNPEDSSGHNNYGQFLCSQGRYEQANEEFMTAAKNPFYSSPEIPLTNAGLCAKRAPDAELAGEYFRQALEKDPEFAPALLQMAMNKFDTGNFMSARAFLERFQQVAQHSPQSLWLAVRTEFALRDTDTSRRYAILLRKKFPKSEEAVMLLEWENEQRSGR